MKANSLGLRITGPLPAYSVLQLLVVTAGMLAALLTLLVAVSYPIVLVGVAVLAVTVRQIPRLLSQRRTARRMGRLCHYCIPGTKVCIKL